MIHLYEVQNSPLVLEGRRVITLGWGSDKRGHRHDSGTVGLFIFI